MADLLKLKIAVDAKKAQESLKQLSNTLQGVGKKFNGVNKNLNRLSGAFRNLNLDANRSNKTLGNFNKTLNNINFAGAIYGLMQLGQAFGKAIQASMDSIETTNLFNVAMGDMAEQSYETIKQMSELTGLDDSKLMSAVGTFNLLARSMGFSSEQAAILSENTTKLALDLASLTNVPFEQALADLRSGLIGQTETVYKYGIDLTEATLQQEAMRLGIEESVRTMTQGEKMALRYSAMIRQSGLAHGDFARTINEPANQLRLLKENFYSLARAIGNVFLPVLEVVLPVIRAVVMALTELINAFATFLGFEPAKVESIENGFGGVSDSVEDTTDNVEKLKKAAKDIAAPFDELNAVNLETGALGGSGGGGGFDEIGGGLSDEFGEALREYDNLMSGIHDKAKKIRDALFEWLGIIRSVNEETGEVSFSLEEGGFLDNVRDAIEDGDWEEVGRLIGEKLTEGLALINEKLDWERIKPSIEAIVTNFANFLNGFISNGELWKEVGTLIANGLMFAFIAANTFFTTFNFEGLGAGIASTINSFFEKMDWTIVGQTIGNGINAAVSFAIGLLQNTDFSLIATSLTTAINTALQTADPYQMAEAIASFINSGLTLLGEFISTLDWTQLGYNVGVTITETIANIDWAQFVETLKAAVNALFDFLGGLISGIDLGTIIKAIGELIARLVGEGAKTLVDYGVELFNSITGNIFAESDFFNGEKWKASIDDLIDRAFSDVEEDVTTPFNNGYKTIMETSTPLPNWFKENVTSKIKTEFDTSFDDIETSAEEAKTNTESAWAESPSYFDTSIAGEIANKFSNSWSKVPEYSKKAKDDSEEKWKESNTWYGENVLDPMTEDFDEAFNGSKDSISSITEEGYESMIGAFENLADDMDEQFKTPFLKCVKDTCNGMISMFEKTINRIIEQINTLKWTFPEELGGHTFSFNLSPITIPPLARGGILNGGQLFQAGEFGKAELIGNYNGQTTVMPLENSGFVEAMYQAVYNAVTSANESGGGSVIENILTLDNEVIYRGQQKVQARKGVQLVSPTFSRG